MRAVASAVAVAACTFSFVALAASPAGAGQEPTYVAPVDAPVADPFREPEGPYGPGNRGIEYRTVPGVPVRAIGVGDVVFAGPVAGALHVTVLHPDGLRSSYSFLASITVRRGQRVATGDVVGAAGERLHLGVRRGDRYIDPAPLLSGHVEVRVRLVPQGVDDGTGLSEAAALAEIVRERGGRGLGSQALSWLADRGRDVVDGAVERLDPRRHMAVTFARTVHDVASTLLRDAGPCTRPGTPAPTPPERRIAVLVGGLGSTSDEAAVDDVDTSALGYDPGDVVRFSYAGGRTPDPADRLDVPASPYSARDSQGDLHMAAHRLADLLLAVTDTAAGVAVDLFGHSQGGVVARLALAELARRDEVPAAIDLVATIGAPHAGAPLAATVVGLSRSLVGDAALEGIARLPGVDLDPDEPTPAQLAPGSDALAAAALPTGVRGLAIAARTDLVVPAPVARLHGETNVVVPVDGLRAHHQLPGSGATQRELALALAGLPPGCESGWDRTLDALAGGAIAGGEDVLGGLLFAG